MPKKIKIRIRKLGKEKAVGLAWMGENFIEIDPRQTEKEFLLTAIHEVFHILFPDFSERKIINLEKKMGDVIWRLGYRRKK